MRTRILLGALALSLAASLSAKAQAPAEPSTPAAVPTVTIINKAAAPSEAAPPALPVTPAAPAKPGAVAAPASPAALASPASPAAAASPSPARSATIEPPQSGSKEAGSNGAAAKEAPSKAQATAAPAPQPAVRPTAPSADTPAAAAPASPPAQAEAIQPPPVPTLAIDIDLTRQMMTVSDEGVLKYTWKVSSARYGYRTPTGTFTPSWMSKMWYSRQYEYAPMPHAIFFHKGVAIHATYATGMLGTPASHGCVRLAPKNAALLYKLVSEHGKARTQIVVHGKPDHSSARVASDDYGYEGESRRAGYRYLPPSYYGRGSYSSYDGPPPGYYYVKPRQRRYYAAPRRYYQPRGLYNSYSYGYGF